MSWWISGGQKGCVGGQGQRRDSDRLVEYDRLFSERVERRCDARVDVIGAKGVDRDESDRGGGSRGRLAAGADDAEGGENRRPPCSPRALRDQKMNFSAN
jgi:hypothetical protein